MSAAPVFFSTPSTQRWGSPGSSPERSAPPGRCRGHARSGTLGAIAVQAFLSLGELPAGEELTRGLAIVEKRERGPWAAKRRLHPAACPIFSAAVGATASAGSATTATRAAATSSSEDPWQSFRASDTRSGVGGGARRSIRMHDFSAAALGVPQNQMGKHLTVRPHVAGQTPSRPALGINAREAPGRRLPWGPRSAGQRPRVTDSTRSATSSSPAAATARVPVTRLTAAGHLGRAHFALHRCHRLVRHAQHSLGGQREPPSRSG